MKIPYKTFSTLEVILLFAFGLLARRWLEGWLAALAFPGLVNLIIRIGFVLLILAGAIFIHNRLTRYLSEKGILQ